MMNPLVIGAAAALSASAAPSQPVIGVATGNWSGIPQIGTREKLRVADEAIDDFHKIANETKCTAVTDNHRLNMSVPFLIAFSPEGAVRQIVVHKINCPTIEAMVGNTIMVLAKAGEYRPTGQNDLGWYSGRFELVESGH